MNKKYNTEEERKAAQKARSKRFYESHKDEEDFKAAQRAASAKYRASHKNKIAEYNAEYMPEWRKRNPEYDAEYRKKNRDKILAQKAEYRKNNKDKERERQAKYHSTPKGRANVLVNNYRKNDMKYNRGECTITDEWVIDNVFSGQCCQYCGESDWSKLGVDRIDNNLPHTPENVVPCCRACNIKRHTTEYDKFMRMIGKIN